MIALRGDFAHKGVAAAVEVILHAGDFGTVLVIGAAFEAGREAHLHFRIDTAGELGIRMEIIHAAAHFEKVERVAGEFFCSGAGRKRAVIEVSAAKPSKARGH